MTDDGLNRSHLYKPQHMNDRFGARLLQDSYLKWASKQIQIVKYERNGLVGDETWKIQESRSYTRSPLAYQNISHTKAEPPLPFIDELI